MTRIRILPLVSLSPRLPRGLNVTAFLSLMRQRRALRNLDDRALSDIGITPEQAAHEAKRPVWDVPTHWLR